MPCSRRPMMRMSKAGVSDLCERLKSVMRHEMAPSGLCLPDGGANLHRRCERRHGRYHRQSLDTGSAARHDHDGRVHGVAKQHVTARSTRGRKQFRLRNRDDSPQYRSGRHGAHGARVVDRAYTQRGPGLCAGRLSSDADEPETDIARRRSG